MLITIRYMIIPINTTYISISILVHFFYFVVLGSDRMKLGEPELKTFEVQSRDRPAVAMRHGCPN